MVKRRRPSRSSDASNFVNGLRPWEFAAACDAIALVETIPHQRDCYSWNEEACTCSIGDALRTLYDLVGAEGANGEVPTGHALQLARMVCAIEKDDSA